MPPKCEVKGCKLYAGYEWWDGIYPKPKARLCFEHKRDGMFDLEVLCQKCRKGLPYYGYQEKTHCSKCRSDDMKDLINKMCVVCHLVQPNFGYKQRTHCGGCRKDDMDDLKNTKCVVCHKFTASFGYSGKQTHCGGCRKDDMDNIYGKMCIVCKKVYPSFGYEQRTHCGNCKKADMEDLKNNMCVVCNKVRPSFGYEKRTHCSGCRKDDMRDLINRMCVVCQKTYPSFGYEKPTHCAACKMEGMYIIYAKMCSVCRKIQPSFGYEKPTHCSNCKTDNMKDLKHILCKQYGCASRPNDKYDGYCFWCYVNLFPDKNIIRNYRTKERAVKDFIDEEFPTAKPAWNKAIFGGEYKRRPDFFFDCMKEWNVATEVDEHGHQGYDCESLRTMQIFSDGGNKPLIMIRFNPDSYTNKDGKYVRSPWKDGKVRDLEEWNSRLDVLGDELEKSFAKKPEKELTIVELFYGI